MFRDETASFQSASGITAAPYSWKFTTRDAPASPKAATPRMVSVDPLSGAEVGMVTAIRVTFDRPMNPETYELADPDQMEVALRFPAEYDASAHRFTFFVLLPRNVRLPIELRGFRSAEGGAAEAIKLEYQVGRKLYLPGQEARIRCGRPLAQAARGGRGGPPQSGAP